MRPETEAGFMGAVRDLASTLGWLDFHPYDSRRSTEGFPDLVLIRGGRLLVAELKSARGRLTPAQVRWINEFREVARHAPNVQVFVWRPADWPDIEQQLGVRGREHR